MNIHLKMFQLQIMNLKLPKILEAPKGVRGEIFMNENILQSSNKAEKI